MSPDEYAASVLFAVENSTPANMLAAIRGALGADLQARDVELLIVDYGLDVLRSLPVDRMAPGETSIAVRGTVAGRAFTSQQVTTGSVGADGLLVHVPVTVRADRRGVLRLRLPAAPSVGLREGLARMGTAVGYALTAVERDTDLVTQAARPQRLSLAAEMQWDLLPGRQCAGPEFTVAGQLEPAYAVRGDNFDWSCSPDHLQLTVMEGMGEGAKASMLTHLAVSALRNARRAGVGLVDQASLADQAVYAHYRGELHLETLLLQIGLADGRGWAVGASTPLLLRDRDEQLQRVELEAQLPLGMFEGTRYTAERFEVRPGDRLFVLTDGVHAAHPPEQEPFGDARLAQIVRAARVRRPDDAVREILRELLALYDEAGLDDDAVAVCLDWRGPVRKG
ncbi:MAG TPA: PP2C family protein-serine/threonine phosphatase [Mycobacteriales bacterium]